MPPELSAGEIVRRVFATATVIFAGLGFVVQTDPRWFVASGACGTMWLTWDLLRDHVMKPLGAWATRITSGEIGAPPLHSRPNLSETVQYLEGHLRGDTSQRVQLNAAIRLEEIYRLVRKDPDRAKAVIRLVRARFPDASELARYDGDGSYRGALREEGST